MKYRKRPVEVEARQFKTNNDADDENMNAIVGWITNSGREARHDSTNIFIQTLEGEMKADVGDFIVKGVKGEFYPVKPQIFQETYDLISTGTDTAPEKCYAP